MANIVNKYCTNGIFSLTYNNCLTDTNENENRNVKANDKHNQNETSSNSHTLTKVIKDSQKSTFDSLENVSKTSLKKNLLSNNAVTNLAQVNFIFFYYFLIYLLNNIIIKLNYFIIESSS